MAATLLLYLLTNLSLLPSPLGAALAMVQKPVVAGAAALLGAVLFRPLLTRIDAARIYPFIAVAFLGATVLAVLFLGKTPSAAHIFATAMVPVSVVLVAHSRSES